MKDDLHKLVLEQPLTTEAFSRWWRLLQVL